MTREKLISLLAEYKKELYGQADINLLKELDDISLEKDFMREAFYLLKVRASKEFTDIMKYNYKSNYTNLAKRIHIISTKANMLNRLFELEVDKLPSSLEMSILLTEPNILSALFEEYANDHINLNIENFSYALSLLVKSIEKNKSTYYADITIKPHSNMDNPKFLSVIGNHENIRDLAITKIRETLPKDIDQKFECYVSFYSKHIIEDKTVFCNTEAYQLTVTNGKIALSKITY